MSAASDKIDKGDSLFSISPLTTPSHPVLRTASFTFDFTMCEVNYSQSNGKCSRPTETVRRLYVFG